MDADNASARAVEERKLKNSRPPLPPFTRPEQAMEKVRLAEDGWNSRDAERVALAYSADSRWRNRDTFLTGRAEIVAFLQQKAATPPARHSTHTLQPAKPPHTLLFA